MFVDLSGFLFFIFHCFWLELECTAFLQSLTNNWSIFPPKIVSVPMDKFGLLYMMTTTTLIPLNFHHWGAWTRPWTCVLGDLYAAYGAVIVRTYSFSILIPHALKSFLIFLTLKSLFRRFMSIDWWNNCILQVVAKISGVNNWV